MKKINLSISNILILLSLLATISAILLQPVYNLGMNNFFLSHGNYTFLALQFIFYQFLHGGILHFSTNSIFIYLFGNSLENLIGKTKFLIFFIFCSVFVGILLLFFSSGNTIGISGFCMAILSFYSLELYMKGNPEYKGGITAIILNIAVGFIPGISLAGHLFGAIAGIIFFGIMHLNKKKTI